MSEELNEINKKPFYKKFSIYQVIAILGVLIIVVFSYKMFFKKGEVIDDTSKDQETEIENKISIPADILKNYELGFTRIRERGFNEEIILPGKVDYDLERMANVGSRVPGRINQVFVKEGDMVGKGAPLCSISSVELGTSQATFLKSKAKLETLKVQYERAKELYEKKIISAREFEMTNVEYKTVKTELETSYNTLLVYGLSKGEISNLEKGKLTSNQMPIRSPLAGTVTSRKAIQGQAVVAEDNLFVVANLKQLWIILDVYEKDLYSVKLGAEATIFTLGDKPESVKARVAHVGEVIDPIKHTAEIRLEVDNKDFKLKPGQTVSAKVQGLISESKSRRIMVLPAEAVHKIEGKSFAFVANEDGTFIAKEVEVGETIDDDIEIREGLEPEMNIVTKGSFIIKSEFLK
ncbi:MAG: efflux RND transporter periplasmic adaptor subunit [Leptospiraceae bacterium]|nr:efflux RND transporter periplasmic adaptor subunit [Leptospiraceae bacterium]